MGDVSYAFVVRLMTSTRPGRSVTNSRPSGAKAIDQGTSRPVNTASTRKCAPSLVVKGSPPVVGGGVGLSLEHARVVTVCAISARARTLLPIAVHTAASSDADRVPWAE